MKYINVIDAKEQFADLVTLISDPLEEVYLTFQGKPINKDDSNQGRLAPRQRGKARYASPPRRYSQGKIHA